jgi:chromosome segregation ATPase
VRSRDCLLLASAFARLLYRIARLPLQCSALCHRDAEWPDRSLHHALLSKRIQVLRDKLTELERKKQELRIDSGKDNETEKELEAKRETLSRSVEELQAGMQALEDDKQRLIQEETQQIEAQENQKMQVDRQVKDIEATKREVKAKKDTIADNEKAIKSLEV